jgi:hypothetical protein
MAFLLYKLAYLSTIAAALSLIAVPSSQAATINVPAGQPTIQGAINAASNGDTVLVAPGTYRENINFEGKAITVTGSGGPAVTTINGGGNGSVVLFVSGEGTGSVLSGFTVTNGNSNSGSQVWNAGGGGIVAFNAGPTIRGNVITQNVACNWGGGIFVGSTLFPGPSAVIEGNQITENIVGALGGSGCAGGGGGGIAVTSTGSTQITGNTISGNSVAPGDGGGGIYLFAVTTPVVENNVITNNSAMFSGGQGGGIYIVPDATTEVTENVQIIQNLIFGNTADDGGGIYVGWSGYGSVIFTSNTIADNNGSYGGSGVYLGVYGEATQYYNNLIIGAPGESALYGTCQGASVTIFNNDLLAPGANAVQTSGCDVTGNLGTNGNVSANPLFLDGTSDFHLQYGSPAVGAGDSSAPNLPSTDLDGNPRMVNGKIDMGVYELQPTTVSLTPASLVFAAQAVGSSSSAQSVTLTNTGNQRLRLAMILGPNFTETDNCGTSVAAGANCTINVTFVPTSVGPVAGSLTLFDNASDNPQRVGLSGTGTGPA